MKIGKVSEPSGVFAEMMIAEKEFRIEWLTDLCNDIMGSEGKTPTDWKRSSLVPVYKGKGDPLECGSYQAIKLLEQARKVVEWVQDCKPDQAEHGAGWNVV